MLDAPLERQVFSGTSFVDFAKVFVPSFTEFTVDFQGVVMGTSAANLLVQFFTDGGSVPDTASSYQWARFLMQSGATSGSGSGSDTSMMLGTSSDNNATHGLNGFANLKGMNQSATLATIGGTSWYYASDGSWNIYTMSGTYKTLAKVNAIRFKPSSGTFSGTITVAAKPRF